MEHLILIPAYNEERGIVRVLAQLKELYPPESILVVDDGSADATAEVATKAGVKLIRHESNMGKGAALQTGFDYALKETECRSVITMDADGQHLPREVNLLIDAFKRGLGDIIVGERIKNSTEMPLIRRLSNKVGEFFISKALGMHLRDTQSGFRLYSRRVLERVKPEHDGFEMETEILIKAAKAGFSISTVSITTVYPDEYSSHFRPVRDFYRISILVLKELFKR